MRKLKLDLEQLAVDSFGTGEGGGVGTVRARADAFTVQPADDDIAITPPITSWKTCATCPGQDTCYISCVTRCSCPTQPCDTCT
ncbi:hypothetical protein [Longimicrobium sp.]|uniref:hypothetical protein n=1 Tax=Longimicrobium sp. TaxID=2029185 RepID=UPI002C7A654C|nr:hypothetical protein [Longimicrobium sp.]HSU13180.1 hypothetical protein [Longimicrobium sp.]